MHVPNMRTCWICGTEYKYCEKCDPLHSWKTMACSRPHYQIVMILDGYRNNIIDVERACEMFGNIGITLNSDFSEYLPAVARDIRAILIKAKSKNESKIKKVDKVEKPKNDIIKK